MPSGEETDKEQPASARQPIVHIRRGLGAVRSFVEVCGRHPFATGLLGLLSVFGLVFGFYSFVRDREDAAATTDQIAEVHDSVKRGNAVAEKHADTAARQSMAIERLLALTEELQADNSKLREQLETREPKNRPQEKFYDLINIGYEARSTGALNDALRAYQQLLSLAELESDKSWGATAHHNLGDVYQLRGELDKAVQSYEKSLGINEALGRQEAIASDYDKLGNVYQLRGELDKAVQSYEKSLTINEMLGQQKGVGAAYANLGNVYYTLGELDRTRELWEKSAVIFEALGAPSAKRVRGWLTSLK